MHPGDTVMKEWHDDTQKFTAEPISCALDHPYNLSAAVWFFGMFAEYA